jgi:hypothetical protein
MVSWNVTASDGGGTADLKATVTYTDAATGVPGRVTTYQGPPANLPPVITSLDPSNAAAGEQVTIHGTTFGATQADPNQDYVLLRRRRHQLARPVRRRDVSHRQLERHRDHLHRPDTQRRQRHLARHPRHDRHGHRQHLSRAL